MLARSRTTTVVVALVVSLALLVVASVAVGSDALSPREVWDAVRGTGDVDAVSNVRGIRWPRTVLALLVGAGLGMAGTIAQGHTRNPLADPGLLGVGAGASFAVVCGIYVADVRTASAYVWLALLGALLATVAVAAIAARGGSLGFVPLALAGAAVSALLLTGISLLILNDRTTLDVYRRWVAGSLAGRDLSIAADVAPFLTVGAVLAIVNASGLNALALGPDVAVAQGHHVGRIRAVGLLAIVLLSGGAVAASGPIGFLGLAAPHLARQLVGGDFRRMVPVSALLGAALLLVADVVGRVVISPAELQVGIVLALAGGPVFIAAYLGVTAAIMLGWWAAPGATFLAFLAVSVLHFGRTDDDDGYDGLLRALARGMTPILPVFLCHPHEVAGIIGLMCDRPATAVAAILEQCRGAGLLVYAALLATVVAGALAAGARAPARLSEAVELVLLAAAAALLPPLLAFAVFFCLLHAVRHLAHLGDEVFPRDGRRALGLAAAIVLPSALAFSVLLAVSWNAMLGAIGTERLVALALQLTASLTVPHALLEWAGTRRPDR